GSRMAATSPPARAPSTAVSWAVANSLVLCNPETMAPPPPERNDGPRAPPRHFSVRRQQLRRDAARPRPSSSTDRAYKAPGSQLAAFSEAPTSVPTAAGALCLPQSGITNASRGAMQPRWPPLAALQGWHYLAPRRIRHQGFLPHRPSVPCDGVSL